VEHDAFASSAPAGYARIEVKDRAHLALSAGVYAMDTLHVGWNAVLEADTSAGPIVLVVRQGLTYNGRIVESGGAGRILVYYTGTNDLRVETGLAASVLAPDANLLLKEAHTAPGHLGQYW